MRQLLLLFSFITILSCDSGEAPAFNSKDAGFEATSYSELDESTILLESPQASVSTITQKIIKTANLRFETQDMAKSHQHILSIVKQTEGYIQNDNSGKQSYGDFYHNITVRVPTRNFQMAVDNIAKGVDYFEEKSISQKDVTEEFVDLQARLKAKRALEDRYINLLTQAKNVKDMLEIERELAQIREEIEAKQGRLKYLQSQVSLSTLNIHFFKNEISTDTSKSYGSKMINAFKGGWNGVSSFFLGVLYLWPLFIFAIVSFIVLRKYLRKKK